MASADVKKKDPDKHYKFGYTCMDGTNPFFVTIEKRMREMVEANGDELIAVDPANDVTLQITQVEDLISQNIDAMFMNPAEAEGILPALDQLKEAGIPIVGFDTEVADLSYLISYTGSDNYNAGKVCGEDLVKKCPDGGDIIVLDSPTMNSVTDRTNGFLDAIEGKGFNIVAQQDAKGNLEVSMGIAEDLLQAHGDVVAIFGGNDPTALGALAAANAAGLTDCMIYGVDGSPDIKAEMASPSAVKEAQMVMASLNRIAKRVTERYHVSACTDITGFGLLGHCVEMAEASDVTFELKVKDIAYMADAIDYAKMGLVPAGTYKNRGYSIGKVETGSIEECYVDLLYDPQTSGGLLLSVSPDDVEGMMRDFEHAGMETTVSIIGKVAPKSDKLIRLF